MYPKLLLLQEVNGLDLGKFYQTDMACRRFVKYIFDDLQKESVIKLKEKSFFSVLIDGATDTSVTENELIYVRYLENGVPENHYISIEDVEHADASGILSVMNKSFKRIDFPQWKEKLVGFGQMENP